MKHCDDLSFEVIFFSVLIGLVLILAVASLALYPPPHSYKNETVTGTSCEYSKPYAHNILGTVFIVSSDEHYVNVISVDGKENKVSCKQLIPLY